MSVSRPAEQAPSAPAHRRGGTLRALRHRNYRLFFLGQVVSLVGSWMQTLAQGWLLWSMSHSEWLLGVLGFAQSIPVLAVGLIGGEAADRFDRRRLLVATQMAALVQATLLAALTLGGWIRVWQIVVLACLLGVINAFDMPGRQAFLVQMVGREDLGNAIALNSTVFNGARIVGPAIAGVVVARWGEGACFAANAASFLAVLASLLAMRLARTPRSAVREGIRTRLGQGFAYAWRTRRVRALLTLVSATGLLGIPYSSLMPAIAGGVLGRGPSGLGILMSFAGAGAIAAALVMARRHGTRGLGRRAAFMTVGLGAAEVVFGLSTRFWLSCAALAMVGFCMMTELASTNTLLQSLVPEELRGRLMSLYVITFMGTAPIGSLLLGKLAAGVGVQPVIAAAGAVLAATGLVFWRAAPRVRADDRPLPPPEPPPIA